MSDTYLVELIRTTEKVGSGNAFKNDPVHKHIQYYTKDGDLLFEECDGGFCDE